MKVLLTGGGTGGHFYPLIAVAEELNRLAKEKQLASMKLYFMSTDPYNESLLYDNSITFVKATAGKRRLYFSLKNFTDIFKTAFGILRAVWDVYLIYPDVVFSKGGFASVPATFAARVLRIPVIVHESDTVPGRANKWAGKFAKRIAVGFEEAAAYFPKEKTAHTGIPIQATLRKETKDPNAFNEFGFDSNIPVIFIMGGSLGALRINDTITDALSKLLPKYQVLHQTGKQHFEKVKEEADLLIADSAHRDRYRPLPYMDAKTLKAASDIASLVITRAGATSLTEIAVWGLPAIVIPIPQDISRDQTSNAFAYARLGAGEVIEEENLTPNILASEIDRLMEHPELRDKMKIASNKFVFPDAATKVAEEILTIGRHE